MEREATTILAERRSALEEKITNKEQELAQLEAEMKDLELEEKKERRAKRKPIPAPVETDKDITLFCGTYLKSEATEDYFHEHGLRMQHLTHGLMNWDFITKYDRIRSLATGREYTIMEAKDGRVRAIYPPLPIMC